ncbi:MAG: hypothetical protein JXR49_02555 [Acidobacteria bacterium]|nr:hypothetical protein [Acidobacteriota bacterium]
MADYSGEIFVNSLPTILYPPDLTPDLERDLPDVRGGYLADSMSGISDDPLNPEYDALLSPEPGNEYGTDVLSCFEELFDKIIVTPRKKECGFVLNDVTWDTNLWNTHRDAIRVLTGVNIDDSGNVQVNNPLGYPLRFAPMHARNFETIVPKDGDATINAVVTFLVTGESGTDLLVTGKRIAVFGALPDWTDPVKERTQYLTSILNSYTAFEQRIALRKNPRAHVSYRVMPIDRRTAAAMEALLYGQGSRIFGVPFWPDAQPLAQPANASDTVIYLNTENRKFQSSGIVVLWRDFFNNEAASISSVAAGSITLTAPINNSWPADGLTYAIPILTGRLEGEARLDRLTPGISEIDLAFQCDPSADVDPAEPDQVYGHDVLSIDPNTSADRAVIYTRTLQILDQATGKIRSVDRSGVAIGQSTGFLWTLSNREEIAAYRAWTALRKGRQAAFWLPSSQHDLVQAVDLSAGVTNLIVKKTGYMRYQYPLAARRYLCFTMLDGSGTRYYRKVTASDEGTDTETLTLDSALSGSEDVPAGSCMISFLMLVRLATDEPEIVWSSRDVAEVLLELVEVPLEINP